MKKTTKLISLLLSVLMVCSCFAGLTVVTASAADAPEQLIYFEYPTDGSWGDASAVKVNKRNQLTNIYCYVYAVYGNENPLHVYAFNANKTAMKKVGDNLYSFDMAVYSDLDGVAAIEDGADYGVIIATVNGKGYQTTDLTMTKDCLGDTIYITETTPSRENAADSSKKDFCAAWRNNSDKCGIKAGITSLNNVLPGYFPASMPKAKPLSDSLKKYLTNPVNNPFYQWEKTDIAIQKGAGCNKDTVEALGTTALDVYNQYMADNAEAIETGTVHAADDSCPVDYVEYEGYDNGGNLVTLKMAAPSVVAAALNLEYPVEQPTTAEPTTEEPTTEEPTTEEPTTEEPTTEAPTTEAPTTEAPTEEPTTEEPTTEAPTEPAPAETVYSVAGSIDVLGNWDATNVSTEMTKGDDGVYSFTTAMDAQDAVLFKVVEDHSWDVAHGDENGNNVVFNVKEACDVTISFNPATNEINVTGTGVEYPVVFNVEAMRAVGNGQGNWLNGAAWDPADDSNMMTEAADNVYEITFENVDASFAYQVKCAANGSWAANWGVPKDSGFVPENGVAFDAGWDGDNANFEVEEDGATVKLQLDLREFDYATKQGAKMTVTVTYPEPGPTEEPTTEEPTTEAPTEEPTTEEPTTEAPTEVPTEVPTEPAPAEPVYSVAGSIDALGNWDATSVATEMTKGDDGVYTFTTFIEAKDGVMFKIVKNHSWDESYGDENGSNVIFNVKEACDVTISFNPATNEINVTGTGVEYPIAFNVEAMRAVGNGQGNWLNGAAWDPADDSNMMTEAADNVYEITFENVDASFAYQVKCAANGSWAANWGVPKDSGFTPENGVAFDAAFDGDNANFEVEDYGATVKIQLDLTDFDYGTKQGAKMTITVTYPEVTGKLYGDANGDGAVTIDDATTLQKALVKMVPMPENADIICDVNCDGRVSILDVTFIQRYLAGNSADAYGYKNFTGKVAIPEN